jgi:capsular polysaccharide biosynthesis protein
MYGRTSLLSASGLQKPYHCASTVTWAAAHYYRHLFGLAPPSNSTPHINILYVSRARLRHHLNDDVAAWQAYRELVNEKEMLMRWREGLHELCGDTYEFVDANAHPEAWAQTGGKRQIRFAAIDPIAHSLETQVHLAGHATLLVGQHGGAMGLSLFLPPGRGAVLEFAVPMVRGNHHFQHMAVQMGHKYRQRGILPRIDVERAWTDLRTMIEEVMSGDAPKPAQ